MTLIDIKNHLFVHFLTQSMFSLKDDIDKITLGAVYDNPKSKLGKAPIWANAASATLG